MSQTIYRSAAFTVEKFGDKRLTVRTDGLGVDIPADKTSPLSLTIRALNALPSAERTALVDDIDRYLARWHKRYAEHCMKCRTEPAVLSLRGNGTGEWKYCTGCAQHAIYGTDGDLGSLALTVRYITPLGGRDSESLPQAAQALCR